jgi:hypothetical protein
MTKKLTISVPDEVADRLAQEDNVSAFIASAVRRVMVGEEVRRRHREVGYEVPERWVDAARMDRERIDASVAQIPAERRADLESFSARLRTRDPELIQRMINGESD